MRPSSTQKATTGMIAAIHTLRRNAGLDEDTYRDLLESETGKRSAKDLTVRESGRVIERLKGTTNGIAAGAVAGLDTNIGRKLRALWIAGYDLGIVRDRTDRAMLSYLERQTGVSHVNFLREPNAGARAIEGLKAWLGRDGKVQWPVEASGADDQGKANKRAVIEAIWLRLVDIGDVEPYTKHQPLLSLDPYAYKVAKLNGWNFFQPHHYDQIQNALGRRMRAALAAKAAEAAKRDGGHQ